MKLFLQTNSSFILYEISNITSKFEFSWEEFKVDGKQMDVVRSRGQLKKLIFNAYTFISPWLDDTLGQVDEQYRESMFHKSEIEYGLIALIALAAGLLFKSEAVAFHVWKKIKLALYSSPVDEELNDIRI